GRIYRIYPADKGPRPWPRLDPLDGPKLVAALDSPNGWQRDMAMHLIVRRNALAPPEERRAVAAALEEMVWWNRRPEARLHALCTFACQGIRVPSSLIRKALGDDHAMVRRHAVRLSALALADGSWPEAEEHLARLASDRDGQVRLQLAVTLRDA